MSSTTPVRSRPATFAMTTYFRWTFSRETVFGPFSLVIIASVRSGTFPPCAVSIGIAPTDSALARTASSKRTTSSKAFRPSSTRETGFPTIAVSRASATSRTRSP